MAQAGVGGSYNNPLKKFKYVRCPPLVAHLSAVLMFADWFFWASKVVCIQWFESPYYFTELGSFYSRKNITHNTVYVRLVRQHVPGDHRNRLPVESACAEILGEDNFD
jgi:hypothetical protein